MGCVMPKQYRVISTDRKTFQQCYSLPYSKEEAERRSKLAASLERDMIRTVMEEATFVLWLQRARKAQQI